MEFYGTMETKPNRCHGAKQISISVTFGYDVLILAIIHAEWLQLDDEVSVNFLSSLVLISKVSLQCFVFLDKVALELHEG